MGARAMTRRVALSIALGVLGATALVALYLGIVTIAQGREHAFELLWGDRVFVGLIGAGFGTQIGLFAYVRLLQRALARESVVIAGAGTATSSVAMVACCAHHLADVLPIIGLGGLAVFLVELRTPLILLALATNALSVGITMRQVLRIKAGYHRVVRLGPATA